MVSIFSGCEGDAAALFGLNPVDECGPPLTPLVFVSTILIGNIDVHNVGNGVENNELDGTNGLNVIFINGFIGVVPCCCCVVVVAVPVPVVCLFVSDAGGGGGGGTGVKLKIPLSSI